MYFSPVIWNLPLRDSSYQNIFRPSFTTLRESLTSNDLVMSAISQTSPHAVPLGINSNQMLQATESKAEAPSNGDINEIFSKTSLAIDTNDGHIVI
ncbi:Hypothetical predicted protein [Octopus vulgaris]|uniref:Uncharacterized protein n=1 Tax=Octopus vulgaris TaxID=6645 RepID=A0AA36AJV5_OCTVU|nr:Hypothetical predicted protein [Octopus vulgaris]